MSYKKNVSGSNNTVDEQFAHNRVGSIHIFSDGSGRIVVCFFCLLIVAMLAWFAWKYGNVLGVLVIITVASAFISSWVIVLCLTVRFTSSTVRQVKNDKLQSNLIAAGEVVAYRNNDEEWDHLSAEYARAGIPMPTVKDEPSGDPRWDAVLDLRREGKGMQAIAKDLKVPYNRVRNFLNQVEGNQGEN